MNKSNLTKRQKWGYCSGIVTESLLYNMYYTYYLVFLTDVAHMNASLAGTVSLISVIWDAVTDPIIGQFADKPGADKRKFMKRAIFPMAITFVAAFIPLGDGTADWIKFIFYTAMTMLFWLAYTVYTIPYYAVVAEITGDYDERTEIRGNSSWLNTSAIFLGNAVPSILPGAIMGMGIALAFGWLATAAVLCVLSIVFGFVATVSLRNATMYRQETVREEKITIGSYLQILKMKPFLFFMMFVFFFLIATSMIQSNFAYLVHARLGFDDDAMVVVIVSLVVAMALIVPIVTKVAEKTDRRTTTIIFIAVMIAALVAVRIAGINNMIMLVLSVVACAIGLACFWTVFYSMAYDLVEVDEYINGKRRESMITAFPQFFQKFGAAIGMWTTGQILALNGYDGNLIAQPETAKAAIQNTATIIPCAFLAVSLLGVILYPVTRKRFDLLVKKLADRKEGREVTEEGIEKLV